MEPGVLLEQERQRVGVVDDLHAMRRVDVARHAERQAVAGVVAVVHRIVGLPVLQTPLGVGQVECPRARSGCGSLRVLEFGARRSSGFSVFGSSTVPLAAMLGV